MIKLHPNILEHDGKKTFAVLPYDEFQRVRDELDDYEDLKDLRMAKAKERGAPVSSLTAVREELNI